MSTEKDFEQRSRAELRRAVADLSPEVRARLDEMAALAAREAPGGRRRRIWRVALPLGGGLAAATLAVFMWPSADLAPARPGGPADDMALLLNVDNLDLLEQMEFYQWLERQPGLLENAAKPVDAQRS